MIMNNLLLMIIFCILLYALYKYIARYSLKTQLLVSVSHSHKYDTYLNEFLFFLIENNCFEQFIKEFEATRKNNRYKKIHKLTEFTNCYKKKDILATSFMWHDTEKGFEYWYNINDKWKNYSYSNSHDIMILINYIKNLNIK